MVKNPPASTGDAGDPSSIPGSGRSPEGGNDNPLQYSCLTSMDREAWQTGVHEVTQSQTHMLDVRPYRRPEMQGCGVLLRSLVSLSVITPSSNKADTKVYKVAAPVGGNEDAELELHIATHLCIHVFSKHPNPLYRSIYFYKSGICFAIL